MRKPALVIAIIIVCLLALMGVKSWLVPIPDVRSLPQAGEFNVHRAHARLTEILGDQRPHPADSEANDAVRDQLVNHLTEMGLRPQVRDEIVCNEHYKSRGVTCARVRNIVASLGPPAGKRVLLSAHYDSTPVGPGAGDAGAGVAAMLETAYILKDRPLRRPVTFLFNEGEELGLLGARAFIARDPLAREVDSLINLEGRGVDGPAHMFETNKPNGAAVAAFARAVEVPVANSLSTDVYRLMPNYTDVNTFEPLGWTTLNLAIIGNETRYHSAGDDLAALDAGSLQHMGDQALALATRLAANPPEPGGERIFMDMLGVELIHMPMLVGALLFGALLIGFAWKAWRRQALGRPLLTVAAAVLLAALIGYLGQALVGLLRPGMFWRADPLWTHLATYASAILAGLIVLPTLGRRLEVFQLRTAFWLFYLLLGLALALVAPGGLIYFLFPPLLMFFGSLGGKSARKTERWAGLAAVLLLYLTLGVMLASLEELLSRGPIWVFAPLGALILLPALIEAKPLMAEVRRPRLLAIGGAFALVGWGVAAAVPAYSADRQQQFTIEHVTDTSAQRSSWSILNDMAGVPDGLGGSNAHWTLDALPHSERKRWLAEAPAADVAAPAIQLIGAAPAQAGARRVRIRIAANGAQSVALVAPEDAQIRAAGTGAFVRPIDRDAGDGQYVVRCFGRSCDGMIMDLVIGKRAPVEMILTGWRPGLPASAQPLVAARPANARPQYTADGTLTLTRVRL